ncbi:MAG: selenocysteine-specific translation elongation factor [Gammaproteobacteria bacterium]|nr:selenocysteine-specific translation elongation factor [Gammaproteobacteria bacterium]
MIVATAGHVDHGKTSLVKALTGVDTDRLEEERARGLTIDLGFAYTDWQSRRWGFIDVPGHQRFIGNMLAGVAAIDVAMLVVAADEGPMPQTLEHLQILDLLGVERGVVALTRIDLADPDAITEATRATRELLTGTALDDAPILPVSAVTRTGLEALQAALAAQAETASRRVGRHFRMAVDRVFTVSGAGLIVTGSAHAGSVEVDDQLVALPHGEPIRVRGIRALDEDRRAGHAGERLALNITGIRHQQIHRGDWLVAPVLARPQFRFDARLRPLPDVTLKSGREVHLHHGASHTMGRITLLDGDAGSPRVHIAVREPVGVLHGDRFILRDSSGRITLAGGTVLDPAPPHRGRRRSERLRQLDAMELSGPVAIARAALACTPLELDIEALAWKLNEDPATLAEATPEAVVDRHAGFRLRNAGAWSALKEQIRARLSQFHAGQPQLAGMGVDEVLAVLDPKPSPAVLRDALRDAIRDGAIARSATRFHLPDHKPRLDPKDARRWQRIAPHLQEHPRQPPVVHDLARTLEMDPAELDGLLGRVTFSGNLIRVAKNRFLLPAAVIELAVLAEHLCAGSDTGSFDARAYRDAAGIGRNLTIDLLEYFDRMGLTRRLGDQRRVVGRAEDIFGTAEADQTDSELAAAKPPR